MKARSILALVALVGCVCAAVWYWGPGAGRLPAAAPGAPARIVSLSPAITETLFALGAGGAIVGVTARCDYPPETRQIARVGRGTSPDLEAIAALRPTLIIGEATTRFSADTLAPIAPTHLLPWLTPAEIVRGVRELGTLVDRRARAEELAARMERQWQVAPRPGAPRVLIVLADQPGRLGPMYFVKPGSLHDVLLSAAGGRNAVEGAVKGAPILSVEGLLQLDPDAIVILVASDDLSPETRDQFVADFRALPALRAVRDGHVRVLNGGILYVTGPRVLAVIDRLAAALRDMGFGAAAGAGEAGARPPEP